MSRYHHNKVTHELEPIAGYGSRVATSVDGKTLTVHSSILNIDGYNYGEGDIATAVQMIAPIESSLVASKAYAAGDQFVYNGLLYKATAAIASGGAIVIGTNCQVAPCVAEQINKLPSSRTLVQRGTLNVTGVSGNWVQQTITFPTPYKSTPLVTVNAPYDAGTGTTWTLPMIASITPTGFRFGWYNASGTKAVIWQAVGEVE